MFHCRDMLTLLIVCGFFYSVFGGCAPNERRAGCTLTCYGMTNLYQLAHPQCNVVMLTLASLKPADILDSFGNFSAVFPNVEEITLRGFKPSPVACRNMQDVCPVKFNQYCSCMCPTIKTTTLKIKPTNFAPTVKSSVGARTLTTKKIPKTTASTTTKTRTILPTSRPPQTTVKRTTRSTTILTTLATREIVSKLTSPIICPTDSTQKRTTKATIIPTTQTTRKIVSKSTKPVSTVKYTLKPTTIQRKTSSKNPFTLSMVSPSLSTSKPTLPSTTTFARITWPTTSRPADPITSSRSIEMTSTVWPKTTLRTPTTKKEEKSSSEQMQTTTQNATSESPLIMAASGSNQLIGKVVGGVIGDLIGVAGCVGLGFAVVLRQRRRREQYNLDHPPLPPPSVIELNQRRVRSLQASDIIRMHPMPQPVPIPSGDHHYEVPKMNANLLAAIRSRRSIEEDELFGDFPSSSEGSRIALV